MTKDEFDVGRLPDFAAQVASDDVTVATQGTRGIRVLVSNPESPPNDEVIASGVLPLLTKHLSAGDATLAYEAAWCLSNVCSGTSEHTRAVVECGSVSPLQSLLQSENAQCSAQASWALGNIAGDTTELRDVLLAKQGLVEDVALVISSSVDIVRNKTTAGGHVNVNDVADRLRQTVWLASNLCRHKPSPPLDRVRLLLPGLAAALTCGDDSAAVDAFWALSYISDGDDERVTAVARYGGGEIVRRAVAVVTENLVEQLPPALRMLGNLSTGSDEDTQIVVDCGGVAAFKTLLSHAKDGLRKESCWALSNVMAGTIAQRMHVIRSGVFVPLIECMTNDAAPDVRKEATWAICNVTDNTNDELIAALLELGIVDALCDGLNETEVQVARLVIDGINNMLNTPQKQDVIDRLRALGAPDTIEDQLSQWHDETHDLAVQLLIEHFNVDPASLETDEDDNEDEDDDDDDEEPSEDEDSG